MFSLMLAAALAVLTPACSRCGGAGPAETGEQITEARDPVIGLAGGLPADVVAFVALRDLNRVSEQYTALRPRLDALVGNVGMVETDLRNTLGVDVARLGELGSIGLDARAGVAVALLGDDAVVIARAADVDVFNAHVARVAQGQPFNLTAPIETSQVAGATVYRFRRQEGGSVKLSYAVRGDTVYVFPDARVDAAILEELAAVQPESSLAAQAPLSDAAARFADSAAVAWLSPVAAGALLGEAAGSGEGAGTLTQTIAELGVITAGIQLRADAIEIETLARPSGTAAERLAAVMAPGEGNPGFGRLVGSDTYLVARSSLDAAQALATARRVLPASNRASLDAALQQVRDRVGRDVETDLIPALGRNVIALATRARMLTLRRVLQSSSPNPGEAATAFGLIVAIELTDRARVERFLDGVVTALAGRAEKFTSGPHTIVGFTDPQSDIGNLVLTDRLLVLVPSRNREDLIAQLGTPSEGPALRTPAGQALVGDATATGIYIDMQAVLGGPIGATVGPLLPEQIMLGLGNLDHVLVRSDFEGGEIRSRVLVQLTPAAAPPATP